MFNLFNSDLITFFSENINIDNPSYQASTDNRSDQLKPNNPEYKGDEEEDQK